MGRIAPAGISCQKIFVDIVDQSLLTREVFINAEGVRNKCRRMVARILGSDRTLSTNVRSSPLGPTVIVALVTDFESRVFTSCWLFLFMVGASEEILQMRTGDEMDM